MKGSKRFLNSPYGFLIDVEFDSSWSVYIYIYIPFICHIAELTELKGFKLTINK